MAATNQICGAVDALATFQQRIIDAINGKFAALRRLAELLEQLGDLTGFLPDISKLIPIGTIDIRLYENLRASCPFLHLPPASENPEQFIGQLQAQVQAAYGSLLAQLNLHPFSRLDALQNKLVEYQQRFNLAALKGTDFMHCLQAACAAAIAVQGAISNLSNTTPQHVVDSAQKFLKNTVADQNKVISAQAQAKVDNINAIKANLKELMNVPPTQLPKLT